MEQAAHRRFAVLAKVPPGQLDAARQRPRNKRRLGAQLAQLVQLAQLAQLVQIGKLAQLAQLAQPARLAQSEPVRHLFRVHL
mmetsp:Transcript_46279/g.107982  ORF Transcript_46279/g.107982 Transcript_46279/m.107982 type:complete len:82 (+) Transcript_46279:3671-3916(+)